MKVSGKRSLPRWMSGAVLLQLFFLMEWAPPWPAMAGDGRYLTGQLLVATPEMSDPRFEQTVLYMVKHDEHGAMGLVVNRPIAKGPISQLLKSLKAESAGASGEIIIHYGGPVEPGAAFILHSDDHILDKTTVVGGGIAVTSDTEILRAISLGKGPRQSLFLLGYAGWGPGQLEAEIKANAWFSIPTEKEFIFGEAAEKKWSRAMDKRKIEL